MRGLNWRLVAAVGLGTYLGLTAGYWLQNGRLTDRAPVCTAWTRGGDRVFCTGWSE